MHKKYTAVLILVALTGLVAVHALAQGKKKKAPEKKASPTPSQLQEYDSASYRYFLFPEFYSYWPIDNNDTILRYDCYDANKDYMNADTLYDIGNAYHIYFIKGHTDYTQTIIDAEGKPHPKLILNKLFTYDRTGPDTWQAYDHVNNYSTPMKEYRKEIVRTDTTAVIDPITNTKQVTIRKYYRVQQTDSNTTVQASYDTTKSSGSTDAPGPQMNVYTFLVPEFYNYLPKQVRDTTFEFMCYDRRDSVIRNVTDYDSVRYYSVFKSFLDSTHHYKDANGKKQPLPVSTIVKRYDRLSGTRWMSVEYPGNKYQELTAYRDIIVATDTVELSDPITEKNTMKVFKHYKVSK